MRRRDVIGLLGSAAVAWPVRAGAQQPGRIPIIGVLGTPAPQIWQTYVAAFEERLKELGWIAGRTVAIEYRWAGGRDERFAELAEEFVRLKVDGILTSGAAVSTVMRVTSQIPIVFAIGADPVGSGHVASLARPGGNVTGLSLQAPDLVGKRLEMIREIVTDLRRLAVLANVAYPASVKEMEEVETVASRLGCETVRLEIRAAGDIDRVFGELGGGAKALYICGFEPLVNSNRARIHALAAAARTPTVSGDQAYVVAGGLLSYGPNFTDLFRRSAEYVSRILRGAKPADLPVQQPVKFDLAINLKTAQALGLSVPPSLLAGAHAVIE
jgi:putative ABC transport system substrate-binding protein